LPKTQISGYVHTFYLLLGVLLLNIQCQKLFDSKFLDVGKHIYGHIGIKSSSLHFIVR